MAFMAGAARPRRRWYRFGLRTLFVLTGALCVVLAVQVNRANNQRRAVARLHALGAVVAYDSLLKPSRTSFWLESWLGIDYFCTANNVTFERPLAHDDDLIVLKDLPYLKYVALGKSGVSANALVHLHDAKYLTFLSLGEENADDDALKHLEHMTQLEVLDVGSDPPVSHVTNAGLAHLAKLKNLTQLTLDNSQLISDEGMVHLEGLINLKFLFVRGTRVTYAHNFRKKVPQCKIIYKEPRYPETKLPAVGDA